MSGKSSQLNPEKFELKTAETVCEWSRTIVFAPHPDDESLGCGGAIALLRKFDLPVSVVTVSDGTLSHPNSRKFPADKLRDLREEEMKNALEILGVASNKITFLRYLDRSVPGEGMLGFDLLVGKVRNIFEEEEPQTVLVPWRRDPHPDHQSTWQLVRRALTLMGIPVRVIEYPIWLWEMAEENDLPNEKRIHAWRLDIQEVVGKKQSAIRAHASQITNLIDDDPQGFRLSPEVLAHFATPFEVFLEEI